MVKVILNIKGCVSMPCSIQRKFTFTFTKWGRAENDSSSKTTGNEKFNVISHAEFRDPARVVAGNTCRGQRLTLGGSLCPPMLGL